MKFFCEESIFLNRESTVYLGSNKCNIDLCRIDIIMIGKLIVACFFDDGFVCAW